MHKVPGSWHYQNGVVLRKKVQQGCVFFSVLVQHPSGDGNDGDPRWISRWTRNWRANSDELRYANGIILVVTSEVKLYMRWWIA